MAKCYRITAALLEVDPNQPDLNRQTHLKYLKKGLFQRLPSSTQSLDCSRGWLVYWITHSLSLLQPDQGLTLDEKNKIANSLSKYQNSSGGFAGGPQQISHLAATYAVVNALFTLNCDTAVRVIDKESMYRYLLSMKQSDGSYTMHVDGETDVRGIYCAVSVATLTGIVDDRLTDKCVDWITCCQTYEGGFGGFPGSEAHGGYTFCAVAALALLKSLDKCDVKSLLRFVTNRQQAFEGGFAGRTNKLVDGCYSFWVGGIFPILHSFLMSKGLTPRSQLPRPSHLSDAAFTGHKLPLDNWLFNEQALEDYLLCCCQDTSGGLIDKPDRRRDYYHTCYGLSGLSVAQNTPSHKPRVGDRLNPVHPLFNIHLQAIQSIKDLQY